MRAEAFLQEDGLDSTVISQQSAIDFVDTLAQRYHLLQLALIRRLRNKTSTLLGNYLPIRLRLQSY